MADVRRWGIGAAVTLMEQLNADMKAAMLARDNRRRDVIRFLKAAVTNAEIEKRSNLSDDEILGVIRTQIKQRRDSIDLFRKGGRDELADEEEAQIAILQDYLPQQMDESELADLVTRLASELGVSTPRDMSRLMPALMQATAGRAEGRTLSRLAKEELDRRAADQA
jgi:uncharacterized protein